MPGDASWAEGVQNRPWVVVGLLVLIAAIVVVGLRLAKRLPPAAWPFTVDSDTVARHVGWEPRGRIDVAPHGVGHVLEKVALAGLVTMIMFVSWPLLDARPAQVALVVTGDRPRARGDRRVAGRAGRSGAAHLGVQVAINTVISVGRDARVRGPRQSAARRDLSVGDVLLFAYIVALIVTLYDRYSARREARVGRARARHGVSTASGGR